MDDELKVNSANFLLLPPPKKHRNVGWSKASPPCFLQRPLILSLRWIFRLEGRVSSGTRSGKYGECSGICCLPHQTGKYGTRPFYVVSGCRTVAHTHPAVSKNALGPVGIPLLRRLRRWAINPTLPKQVKAWGEGPLRPKDINKNCLPSG